MSSDSQEIISKLKAFKQEGMTFFQANEKLKSEGYTPAQIVDAESKVNYVDVVSKDLIERQTKESPNRTVSSKMDKSYQRFGNSLLAEKERNGRPCVYIGLVIPAFWLGMRIHRFWLHRRFHSSGADPRYLWANNIDWTLVSGIAAAGVVIFCLRLYFRSRDRHYREIDKKHSS